MENWQLTLVILASVFVGALIPVLLMIAIAFHRAGREIAEIGPRLTRTLTQIETVSDRVETLSRGFKGGETNIADLLASVGDLSRGLERNMKTIDIVSAILASVGPVIAAFVKARFPVDDIGKSGTPAGAAIPENGIPPSSSAVPPKTTPEGH